MPALKRLDKFQDSALYRRIQDTGLKALVERVCTNAATLLGTVVASMPGFTLHDGRHILNIVAWMETLLGPAAAEISEFDCALCLLAAYTHDLGMTITADEFAALPNDPEYQRHANRFEAEKKQIDLLHAAGKRGTAGLIERHIITDFLRTTHADRLGKRLQTRIGEVAGGLKYEFGGVEFQERLFLVAVSHNQSVRWLRQQFEDKHLKWSTTLGTHAVNYVFVSILLRLADILDFDATRTPRILFQHLGLDGDLASRFERISAGEWQKHLAITGIDLEEGKVTFIAEDCPHPVVEKGIRSFIDMIREEIRACAVVLQDSKCPDLYLPDVVHDITPSGYRYHDWQFHTDHERILELLMGESLYGDPSLCIRELLQNGLDAVELRDLRMQAAKMDKRRHPDCDSVSTAPGKFMGDADEEEFAVTLSWGTTENGSYLRVEDNGTGMTESAIQNYFTRLGRSFYKSPEFSSEQVALRAKGLIATPISTFGIGVLSCFMIADRIDVKTHPGPAGVPLDLEVLGPGSLFVTRTGTRKEQGTTIQLWLKAKYGPFSQSDRETVYERLRKFFEYQRRSEAELVDSFDPGFVAGCHVVWPKYAVRVQPPGGEPWIIDDSFHSKVLAPIDQQRFAAKASEWGEEAMAQVPLFWHMEDWVDDDPNVGTGTRIRFWEPRAGGVGVDDWKLRAFVAPQVRKELPVTVVQSMQVKDPSALKPELPCAPGYGCRIWIDCRGKAAPRLKADRNAMLVAGDWADWREVWSRFARGRKVSPVQCVELLRHNWREDWSVVLRTDLNLPTREWARPMAVPILASAAFRLALARDISLDLSRDRDISLDLALDLSRALDLELARALDGDFYLDFDRALALARDRALDRALDLALALALAHARAHAHAHALARDLALALNLARALDLARDARLLAMNTLQEAFYPDLERSWPPLNLQAFHGKIGDATLSAPAVFRFQTASDHRSVAFADPEGLYPQQLAEFGYDLCFPMSAIPLGSLRKRFPEWREDRRLRPLAVLPFLVGGYEDVYGKHAEILARTFHPLDGIFALLPPERLWWTEFDHWTVEDWASQDHKSVLWDIATGKFFEKSGIHHRDQMRT